MKILITGSSGYVGGQLLRHLPTLGFDVLPLVRHKQAPYFSGESLLGADVVIHAAGLAHIYHTGPEGAHAFKLANTTLTTALAELCAAAHVPKFIYFSSIAAREVATKLASGMPTSTAWQQLPYAMSKLAAEQALASMAGNLQITCLRPPMIYGQGAPGNMQKLQALVQRGLPVLPFGSAVAPRHYLGIDNLLGAISALLHHMPPGFNVYELADAEAISTRDLIKDLCVAAGRKPPYLLPVPAKILQALLGLVGQGGMIEKLFGELVVNNAAFTAATGWHPQVSVQEGLRRL